MEQDIVQRVKNDPNYRKLTNMRSRFGWLLALSVVVVYYGFTALNAFDKPFMASKIGNGVMSWGVPLGLFVIVFTVIVTAIYVRRANNQFDALTEAIQRNAADPNAFIGNDSGAGNPTNMNPIPLKVRA
jgi:uncharacterized membrane protein (DUF485 family)